MQPHAMPMHAKSERVMLSFRESRTTQLATSRATPNPMRNVPARAIVH